MNSEKILGVHESLRGDVLWLLFFQLADCLKQSPVRRVVVQGNCDERGTAQYNVALGSRRAEAARKYLSDLGAGATIDTVSFGKEKPICTQSSEDCWARNRRDDFVIER